MGVVSCGNHSHGFALVSKELGVACEAYTDHFPVFDWKICKDGVNRWTDNTWSIKRWMVKTRGMMGADVDRYLQITGDFDQV